MEFDATFVHGFYELLAARRDVRRFRQDPVPEALLEHVLQAAHLAPSVGLSQPWRFVRVQSQACREAVVEEFERQNDRACHIYPGVQRKQYLGLKLEGLRESPEHLLVCHESDPEQGHGLGRQSQPATLRDSTVCAIQNLWLAARALGLGVGWVSILDPAALRDVFGLPPSWRWVAYLCLGWPADLPAVPELETAGWEKRRPLHEVVFAR